jgi:hypothetical protein
MGWEYCLQHRWEKFEEYEIDLEQKDLRVVTDSRGVEHKLLRGQALNRQRIRTPEPTEPKPKVEIAPVVLKSKPPAPEEIETLESGPLEQSFEASPEDVEAFYEHVEGDQRLHGRVRIILPDRHGYIDGDDGESYLVFLSSVQGDAYGRQFLNLGEEVTFVPALSTKGKLEARDVIPLGPRETAFDSTYRDDGVITKLYPDGSGFAERSTGETLYFYRGDVVTHGSVVVGAQFRFRPCKPRDGRKMFRAKEIELYRVGEIAEEKQ